MRVLISESMYLMVSYKAIVRARELGAEWAMAEHTPLIDDPEHYGYLDPEVIHAEGDQYMLPSSLPRHDPILLQVFDEMGWEEMAGADGYADGYADKDMIYCVEVPEDVTYYISCHLHEWVEEQHRCWTPQGVSLSGIRVFTKNSKFTPNPLDVDVKSY